MRIVSILTSGAIAAAAFAAPAYAVAIPDSTLVISNTFLAAVTLGATEGSFKATNGPTAVFGGSGAFETIGAAAVTNGTINFSNAIGGVVTAPIANYLTFSGYSFSVDSVTTTSYVTGAASNAVSLYLLGTTIGAGYDATATSLTLTFNNTSGSFYSSSATLAVPPAGVGSVPEAATWGMMVIGFGAMGATMRRKRTSVTFA